MMNNSEMKKYRAESIQQYFSLKEEERLRRKGVTKEMCFKFFKELWSRECKQLN
jgi:hypothetical protein